MSDKSLRQLTDETLAEFYKRLGGRPDQNGWYKITLECRPEDGRVVLVCADGENLIDLAWLYKGQWWVYNYSTKDEFLYPWVPTHWQPAPLDPMQAMTDNASAEYTPWVRITERIPEEGSPICCLYSDGDLSAWWHQGEWYSGGLEQPDIDVTHWMLLPTPPMEDV